MYHASCMPDTVCDKETERKRNIQRERETERDRERDIERERGGLEAQSWISPVWPGLYTVIPTPLSPHVFGMAGERGALQGDRGHLLQPSPAWGTFFFQHAVCLSSSLSFWLLNVFIIVWLCCPPLSLLCLSLSLYGCRMLWKKSGEELNYITRLGRPCPELNPLYCDVTVV